MKSFISYSFLAAVAASGMAFGAEATTTPVGYTTEPLVQGFNAIGLTLNSPVIASGKSSAINSDSVGTDSIDFTSLLSTGSTYILQLTSGVQAGTIQVVTSWTANSVNTTDNLLEGGAASGDSFNIRKAPTLEEVFGTVDSVLKKATASANADIVWVPNGPGTYDRYFLNNSSVWRNAAGGAASDIPLVYHDGIFLQKKDPGTVSFVQSGEVKLDVAKVVLVEGFNLVSTIYPVGSTLQNIGLHNTLKRATASANADIVWIPNGPGTYDRYFVNTTGAWRNAAGGAAPDDLPLTSAVFIQRKDIAVAADLVAPSTYAN